jgi:hypothetical protein
MATLLRAVRHLANKTALCGNPKKRIGRRISPNAPPAERSHPETHSGSRRKIGEVICLDRARTSIRILGRSARQLDSFNTPSRRIEPCLYRVMHKRRELPDTGRSVHRAGWGFVGELDHGRHGSGARWPPRRHRRRGRARQLGRRFRRGPARRSCSGLHPGSRSNRNRTATHRFATCTAFMPANPSGAGCKSG